MERLLLLTVLFNFLFQINCLEGNSSVYYENESEQTINIFHSNDDDIEENELQLEILNLLGLPEGPKRSWTHTTLRQSAPIFLLKIYESMSKESNESNDFKSRRRRSISKTQQDKLITPFDVAEVTETDNVVTFMSSWTPFFNAPFFQQYHKNLLWFNTRKIPKNLNLVTAQLKIYKRKLFGEIKQLVVAIYRINIEKRISIKFVLVSSIQVSSAYEGWLELNITTSISQWILNPRSNKGLYIEATFMARDSNKTENVTSDSGLASIASDDRLKPFMVGYFKSSKIAPIVKFRPGQNGFRQRRQYQSNFDSKLEVDSTPLTCQRLKFSVDFKTLNWLNWIVAPEKFDSYYCSGDCSFPLNGIHTTNHAIIQTLAQLKNPSLPKPGCAPVALTSITIIYHISQDLVNMKKYNNMVVEDCGCL